MTTNDAPPPPGSEQALDLGCTCPVQDNYHGRGAYILNGQPQYWIAGDCPLHGKDIKSPVDKDTKPSVDLESVEAPVNAFRKLQFTITLDGELEGKEPDDLPGEIMATILDALPSIIYGNAGQEDEWVFVSKGWEVGDASAV